MGKASRRSTESNDCMLVPSKLLAMPRGVGAWAHSTTLSTMIHKRDSASFRAGIADQTPRAYASRLVFFLSGLWIMAHYFAPQNATENQRRLRMYSVTKITPIANAQSNTFDRSLRLERRDATNWATSE